MPTGLSSGPNLLTLLRALRRRWLLALSLGLLVGAIVAGATWWFLPQPKFIAVRKVRILSNPDYVLSNVERAGSGDQFQRSQMAYVTDRLVLNDALNIVEKKGQFEQNLPSLDWLETNLKAEFTSPEIMQVTLSGENPTQLTVLVDGVVDAYLSKIGEERSKAQDERLTLLRELKSRWDKNLSDQRERLQTLAKVANTVDKTALATTQTMIAREFYSTRGEWKTIQRDLKKMKIELDEKLKKMVSGVEQPVSEAEIDVQTRNDPAIKQHQARKDAIQELLNHTITVINNPEADQVKKLKQQEEAEVFLINAKKKELAPSLIKMLQAKKSLDLASSIANLKDKISFYEIYEKQLEGDVKSLEEQTTQMATVGPVLAAKNFDITQAEKTLEQATAAVNALEVEKLNPNKRIREWGPAFSKRPDDLIKRAGTSGAAGLGGLGLVILAIAFLEFRSRKIDSTDEVVYGLGMPLVGTLPSMPSRSRRLVGTNGAAVRWKGMLTESVDAVRTLLLHAAHNDGLRVVMVTSAVGGEGKTSLSCHLAASLARSGRKTLLVDGDMRNPSCHRMFEVELESGLSELLRGEIEVAEAIHATPAPTLSVLPAGQCDAVALQSMAQGNLKPIFAQVREQFDFVIVDSCPVLPVADSLLLGQQADAVVLSLLRDVSRMPKVYAAYQRLAMLGIRMLGAVVSGTQEAAYGSNYHYIVPRDREQAAV
jgi:capsular exopolysaccharide synthesis family protein